MTEKKSWFKTDEQNGIFNDYFFQDLKRAVESGDADTPVRPTEGKAPVDIGMTSEAYVLRMDMPGVFLDDVEITVDNDILTISAVRNAPAEDSRIDYHHAECFVGKISRRFKLGQAIRQDQISADLTEGVLEVLLPLKKNTDRKSPKRILC